MIRSPLTLFAVLLLISASCYSAFNVISSQNGQTSQNYQDNQNSQNNLNDSANNPSSNGAKKANANLKSTLKSNSNSNFNSNSDANLKPIKIAILQIVEHEALNATRRGIVDELKASGKNFDIVYESAQGNPALASQIAQKFVGMSPEILVGLGTTATQSLISSNRTQKIPLIFSSVTDPISSRIVKNLKEPGDSVTGASNYIDPQRQFETFKEILPNLKRLGVIYNPGEANSVVLLDSMEKIAPNLGLTLVNAAANGSVQVADATLSLIGKVDAIFINNDNTALSAFDSIVKIATQHDIPVFVSDTDMLNKGALAALGPDQYDLGRQTGKLILRVLEENNPGSIPVLFPEKVELLINFKAAKALNLTIPQSVIEKLGDKVNNHE